MSDHGTAESRSFPGKAADIDTLVIGTAPAQSIAMLDAVMTQALGLAMINAITAQQNASVARNAAVLMACTGLLSIPIADVATSGTSASRQTAVAAQAAPADMMQASSAARPDVPSAMALDGACEKPDRVSGGADGSVADTIDQIEAAVLASPVIRTSGAGKAYQAVAQSAAIAVQDATDALRGSSIIAATAASVAMIKFLTHGDPRFLLGLTAARDMMINATDDLARAGATATTIVKQFPSG